MLYESRRGSELHSRSDILANGGGLGHRSADVYGWCGDQSAVRFTFGRRKVAFDCAPDWTDDDSKRVRDSASILRRALTPHSRQLEENPKTAITISFVSGIYEVRSEAPSRICTSECQI